MFYKKKILPVVMSMAILTSIQAQVFTISTPYTVLANENWDYDTVFVDANIVVNSNARLTIASGTTFIFRGYYGIKVNGSLHAAGMVGDTIRFEYFAPASYDQYISDTLGGWRGIYGRNTTSATDSIILEYCKISHVKKWEFDSSYFKWGGGITIKNYPYLSVSHSQVNNCTAAIGSGIYVDTAKNVGISHSGFYNLSNCGEGGVFIRQSKLLFSHSEIIGLRCNCQSDNPQPAGNGGGLSCINYNQHDTIIVQNSLFSNNGGILSGINVNAYFYIIRNNIITNNFYYGIFTLTQSWSTWGGVGYILNNTVVGNGYYGIYMDNWYKGRGYVYNCIVRDNFQNSTPFENAYEVWGGQFPNNNLYNGPNVHYSNFPDIEYDTLNSSIYDDPLFINAPPIYNYITINAWNYDYSIPTFSPCANMGAPDSLQLPVGDTDFLGNPRKIGERVDIGAIESFNTSSIEEVTTQIISVYPNPVKNKLYFINGDLQTPVYVYNLQGALLKTSYINSTFNFIDFSALNKGLYVVRQGSNVWKVIKY